MIAILGGGSFAREVYCHIVDIYSEKKEFDPDIVFVDTLTSAEFINVNGKDVPVHSTVPPNCHFVMGVADVKIKRKLVSMAIDAGALHTPAMIHPSAVVRSHISGAGVVICPNVTITTNVNIGNYVTVNCNSVIGHDSVIGDYTTISPLVMVSGGIVIGEDCFLGASSFIRENLTLSPGTIIGASACVVKNSNPGDLLTGVPARARG